MKTELDCFPCIIRQSVETARLSTEDPALQRQAVNQVLDYLKTTDTDNPPPQIGKDIYQIIGEVTGQPDPYKTLKHSFNEQALALYDELKRTVYLSEDPLYLAAKLSAAGNVIDFGVPGNGKPDLRKLVETIRKIDFDNDDFESFAADLKASKSILFLADNAGEIVFDKLLIEIIRKLYPERRHNITVVVRGNPVINDATMEDALFIGLERVAKVIDNGDNAPATVLQNVSDETKIHFHNADLVIAKGQGNYETLDNELRLIYFIFKVKCPVIADYVKYPEGSLLLLKNRSMA